MKGKKGKKEQAQIGGDCTDRRGRRLTVCTVCAVQKLKLRKLKSNVGSNFSHTVVLSPPLATWPSHIWPVSLCPFTLSSCNCHHLLFFFFDKFIFRCSIST